MLAVVAIYRAEVKCGVRGDADPEQCQYISVSFRLSEAHGGIRNTQRGERILRLPLVAQDDIVGAGIARPFQS